MGPPNDMTKHAVNEQPPGEVLRGASFATLEGSAITPAAKKLIDTLNERVIAQVALHEAEPNATKTNRVKLKKAVEAFVADLLMAQTGKQPKRWVYRALKPQGFTGAPVGYRVFMPLQRALRELGLVEHMPGVDQWTSGFDDGDAPAQAGLVANRWAARFCATPELLKLSTYHGVPPSKASDHFDFGLPKQPLQKRAASKRDAYGNKAPTRREQ
jgi:hypothetical protein